MSAPESLVRRIRGALRSTLTFALIFALWVVIGYFVTHGANVQRYELSLLQVIAWYVFAALAVACVVGCLQPWATSRSRGALVGFLASLPLSLSVNYTFLPDALAGFKLVLLLCLIGIVLGAPVGAMYWQPPD